MQSTCPQVVVASAEKKCYATTLIRVVPCRVDSTSPHSGVDEGPIADFAASSGSLQGGFSDPLIKHPAVVFAVQRGMCTLRIVNR